MLGSIDSKIKFNEYSKNDDDNLIKTAKHVLSIPLKRNMVVQS
jgi:hypothetical protein